MSYLYIFLLSAFQTASNGFTIAHDLSISFIPTTLPFLIATTFSIQSFSEYCHRQLNFTQFRQLKNLQEEKINELAKPSDKVVE
jgi:hypothetical protein